MTAMKLMCAFAVIVGCGYLGIMRAAAYDTGVRQIGSFIIGVRMLETEITVRGAVLSDAMYAAGDMCVGAVSDVFKAAARSIEEHPSESVKDIWKRSMEDVGARLQIGRDAENVLSGLSAALGNGTRITESGNIRAAAEKLALAEEAALKKKSKNSGLCRSLGFAFGILITVLLL